MRKFHILSSVALAFSLFFTLGTTAMQAQDGSEFAGGNGTEANPWQIATKKQLAAIDNYKGDASKGKYFLLTKDLEFTLEDFSAIGDFNNNGRLWVPLCYGDNLYGEDSFQGTFDGGNHEISGLRSTCGGGIFHCIRNASVKDLTVSYKTITGTIDGGNENCAAGLSSFMDNSVIDNCHVIADISASGRYVGGLVGEVRPEKNYIINSSFKGSISANSECVGGIAGGCNNYYGTVYLTVADCVVEGDISSNYWGESLVGGIIGTGPASIQSCYVNGNIEGIKVGGFFGSNFSAGREYFKDLTIKESSFVGKVTGDFAGGLVGCIEQRADYEGQSTISISSSYVSGEIIGKKTVGGLVGSLFMGWSSGVVGTITKSCTTGELKIDNGTGLDVRGCCAGGLVGLCQGKENNEFFISDSYSHCKISVTSSQPVYTGGLVGCGGNLIIQRSYAMGEIKGDQSVQASVSGNHAYVGGLVGGNEQKDYSGNLYLSFVSVLNSVAMNLSLVAPHGDKTDTGRIIGGSDNCDLGKNYALDTMTLKISNKDVTVTGTANDKNGLDKSASALAQKSTYTGLDWDFDNIWKMSVNGYPIFIWQEDTPIATAPIIITQPISQTVNEGNSVTFSVVATGTEPLSYQWYKDSAAISGATGSSYTIGSAKASDEGSYFVIVSNSVGNAVSSVATLTVIESPKAPVIIVHPVSQTVDVGQQVTFSVVATGTEPLNYQWLKNGATIPGATKASYTITSAKMEDAGNYMVIVSNSAGVAVSNSATLTVKDPAVPPVIIVQPMSQEVLIGESVTFSVVATGTEPLSYQWLFNGNPIPGATGATYYIGQVTEAHEGNYSVIVSNVAGTAISSTAVLTVKILPPVIVVHPQTQIIMKGSTATFAVIAEGYGLSYQWTFNGKDIAGANQPVYMIPVAEAVNVGSYAVKVSNKAGSVTSQSAMLWLNNLQMYAGVEVYGPIGAKFTVWYKDDAESGEWKKLTSSTVSASPTVVIDYDSPQNKKRFYKVEIE